MSLLQLLTQQVGEQMVIAIPAAPLVQWNQEHVRELEPPQDLLRPSRSRRVAALWSGHLAVLGTIVMLQYRGAQITAEPAQDRGLQKELLDLWWLPFQDLLRQVVDDVTVGAGERADERLAILWPARSGLHRKCGELKADHPTFRSGLEPLQVFGGETELHHVVEKGRCLLERESELGLPDLDQLSLCTKSSQGEGGVLSTD